MKRLFYVTNDLDDAESISDEVHQAGIDDHHFYVLSRDEKGIKTHHLHGSKQFEKTKIISAKKRTWLFIVGLIAACLFSLPVFTQAFSAINTVALAMVLSVGILVLIGVRFMAGSFDNYFMAMFNERLDAGEVVIIIDVSKQQASEVEHLMDNHPKAQFIADSSNLSSPLPE